MTKDKTTDFWKKDKNEGEWINERRRNGGKKKKGEVNKIIEIAINLFHLRISFV